MVYARSSIPDFSLANAYYASATVSVFQTDADGERTTVLAPLYEQPVGTARLANPQTLDSQGKWVRPVYVDRDVMLVVSGRTVGTHSTGVITIPVFTDGAMDTFTGDGATTTFTLSRAASTATFLDVTIDGARQQPDVAYTVNGTTSLVFSEAPPVNAAIFVIHSVTTATALTSTGVPSGGISGQVLTKTGSGSDAGWTNVGLAGGDSARFADGRNGIIIPCYLYPNNPYSDATVQGLLSLIRQYHTVPVLVVVNPSDGPGVWDGNYAAFIRLLQGAGAKAIGYVSTNYALRSSDDVRADIFTWLSLYPDISGIFLDEQPYNLTVGSIDTVALYKSYTDYAHSLDLWPVVANPGTNQRSEHFATRTADVIIVHENSAYPVEATLAGNYVGGHADYPYVLRAGLVYNQNYFESNVLTLMKYVQYFYVTADTLPNPWDTLSASLAQQMALCARGSGVVSVMEYGAVGDGTTDDSVAFMAAFAAARAAGGGTITMPYGTFNLASMTASVTLRVFSGCTVRGAGYNNSIIKWNDDDGISLFRGPTSGRVTDCVLEDFGIRGTQDTRGNASAYPILITSCDNIHIRRVLVEKSRVFGMAIRSSKNVTVQDCVVRLCGRDGINIAQATRYIITGNQVSNCDDDGIAAHTDTSGQESTPNGGVISGNTLFDVQGIKVLGARHCVISDNTLDCVKAQGISVWPVTHTGTATEGVASMLNVVISGNKISNVLDRTAIDGLNASNNYINIGGHSAQAGTLNAVPGENYTTAGTIIPYYDYLNNNGAATTVPTPGSNGVIISGNILSRTLKGGVAFSTYGRGLIFSRGGWYDPVFTAAFLGQTNGIVVTSGVVKNIQISDNIFTGLSTGIGINLHNRIDNLVVKDNLFWDILNYGFIINPGVTGKILRSYVEQNIFDMDPLHSHSNRGANGTWLANSQPTAIQFQSGDGGVIVRGNTFRNVCRDSTQDTSALNTLARFENNYIEADPTTMGSFSTSNKGVGIIRRDGGVTLIHTDSDPASATYGRVLTPGGVASSSMPSTGKYLAGTFIRNNSAATSAGKIIQGWHRLTTGTGHVLGTDWLELSYVTDINAVLVTATGSTTARSLAARFADKFNVKNYGALGDSNGTSGNGTNDSAAIQLALNAANTAGGGVVYFPKGIYRKADTSASLIMYSNTTMEGDGDCSVLFHDDTTTNARMDLLTANSTSNISFRNFKILSTADLNGSNTNISQGLSGSVITNLRCENVTFQGLRFMSTAFSRVNGAIFTGCRLRNCMRDGLRCTHSYNVVINGNHFENVSDDCVALHSVDAYTEPAGSGFVVTNNTFTNCQTIKVLGGKRVVISGNTFSRMLRTPILVKLEYGLTEGASPLLDVTISNNVIQDTFSLFGTNTAIEVGSYPYSMGGGATQPGVNAPPFDSNWLNNIDTGAVVNVGASGIRIENNTISRTLPAVASYSLYGFGQMYDWNYTWGYDPAIPETGFNCHGIVVKGPVRGLRVCGNVISGMGLGQIGIYLSSGGVSTYPDFVDTLIEGNVLTDCPDVGMSITGGDANAARNLIIRNNIINQDPYFRNASHSADNTWTSGTAGPAIQTNGTIKGLVVTGNWFAHCGVPISPSTTSVAYVRDNYILCDPSSIADNALNKGVRALTQQYDYIYIKYDGDPTSGTFGEIANMPLSTSAAIPTTGWYAAGHFVKAASLVPTTTTGFIKGWLRLTTGTAHVSGTDWSVIAVPTYSTSGTMTMVRNDTGTNAQLTLGQSGTGDAIVNMELTGTRAWIFGVDNSDSDKFKLASANSAFASGVALEVTTGGDLTLSNGNVRLTPRASAPASPLDGMIAYADGTSWNPGSGAGVYAYIAAVWTKL
jgi:polygalacturonase